MSELVKAVIAVMKAVRGMEKNSRVGSGRAAYDGTKDADVKEAFNEAMAANGLCVLPIGIDESTRIDRWEEDDPYNKGSKKTRQQVFTKVKTKYLLLHESGQSQEIVGYGHGVDPQDKGAGKATTYALKNALLLSFLTPVGKMPDTDTDHSNDIATPPKKAQSKIKAGDSPPENGFKRFLDAVGKMKAELTESYGESAYYDILGRYGFEHANEIKRRSEQEEVYTAMKEYLEEGE